MGKKKELEVFGSLTKTETVFTIDNKIIPGTLVFEAMKPFPGYYYDTPTGTKPLYLYLTLNKEYALEEILRASHQVQLEFDNPFDAGKGFMNIYDTKYNILRIRHLKDYNLLESLQNSFSKNGIEFLHKAKKYKNDTAQVRIVKFFLLQEIDTGIYLDKLEKKHAYLEIPRYISMEEFTNIYSKVKYNWQESTFDATRATFYYGSKLHEVIRIYSDKLELMQLKPLSNLFLEKMK
jgi:hypothetical protein